MPARHTIVYPQGGPRAPSILFENLPTAMVGTPYSFQFLAAGGVPPYTFSVVSFTPNTGGTLSVSSAGVLSGTPGTAETETIVLAVTDSLGQTPAAPTTFSLTVTAQGTQPGPQKMYPGPTGSTWINFSWASPAGVVPTSYNVYRSDLGSTPLQTGIVNDPARSSIPWCSDGAPPLPPLNISTTYTYTVTAIVNGVETQHSAPLTITTLAGGNTPPTPPNPCAEPGTGHGDGWIVLPPATYAPPAGGHWWFQAGSSTTIGGTPINTGAALATALANYAPGDIIVIQAGVKLTQTNGFFMASPANPNNRWTYVISSEDPAYKASGGTSGGTLPAYSYSTALGAGCNYSGVGGNWVTTANLPAMPQLSYTAYLGGGVGSMNFNAGLSYVRFVGIAFVPQLGSAQFQGYLAGSTLTVTSVTAGTILPKMNIYTTGNIFEINVNGTGSGGVGTYVVQGAGGTIGSAGSPVSWYAAWAGTGVLVNFPLSTQTGTSPPNIVLPLESIYFDRCYFGNDSSTMEQVGSPFSYARHGVICNCNHLLFHQCMGQGFMDGNNVKNSLPAANTDSSFIIIVGGQYVCIQNTYCEAVTEAVFSGGIWGDPNHMPSDWVTRYCFNWKNPSWWSTNAGLEIKNHWETKCCQRAAIYGCLHANGYWAPAAAGGQHGRSIIIGARSVGSAVDIYANQENMTVDVDVHDNVILNCGPGIYNFNDVFHPSLVTARVRCYNNLIYHNPPNSTLTPSPTEENNLDTWNTCPDFIYDHNTHITNAANPNWQNSGLYPGCIFGAANAWSSSTGYGLMATGSIAPVYQPLDRSQITNNVFDGKQFLTGSGGTGQTVAYLLARFVGPGTIISNNLITFDTRNYNGVVAGCHNNVTNIPYASIGFAAGGSFDPTNPPPTPSAWTITGGTYATFSTTGGPIGYISPLSIQGMWWAPNSVWNVPIPAGTFNSPMSNSATVIAAYQAVGQNVTTAFNVSSSTFTAGLIVAPPGTATISWNFTYNLVSRTLPLIPAGGAVGTQIVNAAAWFASQGDTDRSIDLYSSDTGIMYNIYPDANTTNGNGPIKITTASPEPLAGCGWWNQANFSTGALSAGTASGASQVGGSIKPSEWTAGIIPHALMGAWPQPGSPNLVGANSSSPDWGEAFIFPARGSDGGNFRDTTGKLLPEGARLQLDPSLTDAQLTALGVPTAMLPACHAMQTYGWYCMDVDGNFSAQIKFLSTNPYTTSGFNGPYSGAANLPMALMAHINWIPGPYIVGTSGLGPGIAITNTTGGCSYTTNYGSGDGLVHVGDVVTVYAAYPYFSTPGTGSIAGFAPSNNAGVTSYWEGVSYKVLSVGAGTFTLGTLAGAAITSTAGTINAYFTTCTALDSVATALASGYLA